MEKNYRPNVAGIILSPNYPFKCEVFIAQRNDIKGAWQFPQGGIDEDETPQIAILRELKEEIGTNNVDIITSCPDWYSYDFPEAVREKMKPFDGQRQKYFLLRLKSLNGINLHTKHPEFDLFKFVDIKDVLNLVNHFKKGIYSKVLKYFKEEGYI